MDAAATILVVASYLLGSLPMGLWIGLARGVDLRTAGSGNIGATNAGRVLGRRWFLVVFALDFMKGFVPAVVVARGIVPSEVEPALLGLGCGVAAVVGHAFSCFLRFRGGKGVATATGLFTALAPLPTVIALVAWLAVRASTGIVSLASVVAAMVLPLACIGLDRYTENFKVDRSVRWAALLVAMLILVRHRANLGRLLRGEEPRVGRKS